MKSFLIAITLCLCFFCQTGFASSPKVSEVVLRSFENDFKIKDNVEWTEVGGLYKATFIYKEQEVYAFYNAGGDRVAIGRKLNQAQLPLSIQIRLQEAYAGYALSDLFEVIKEDESCYYVTAKNAKEKLVLEANDGQHWNIYRKIKIN